MMLCHGDGANSEGRAGQCLALADGPHHDKHDRHRGQRHGREAPPQRPDEPVQQAGETRLQ